MNSQSPSSFLPCRIAILLPRFSRYGGVEQFGYRLAEALAGRGHAVDFICARQEIEAPYGVRVLPVGRGGGIKAVKMLWFLLQAERLRRRGGYDLSISLGKTWKQDMIRVGGGPLEIFWEKSEKSFEHGLPRLIKRFTRRISPANWLTLAIERHQFTAESEVVAVSHLVRDWLLQAHKKLDPARVRVIYNRPDVSRFTPAPPAERANRRVALLREMATGMEEVGAAGSLIFMGTATTNFQLKGIGPLITTLPLLPANVHLFIAGGRGAVDYHTLAKHLGVAERVHFCGKVEDMPAFMQALDIFVLPTFYDACSNAVLEALAAGCRVLTSAVNGAAYFLPQSNILADPGDVEGMAVRITRSLAEPQPKAFVWPKDIPSGMDAFVGQVEQMLGKKQP